MFNALFDMYFNIIRSNLGSYHALFRDGSHSGTDICVVFKYVCALDSCCKNS